MWLLSWNFCKAHSGKMVLSTTFVAWLSFVGHGIALCGHVNPHCQHVLVFGGVGFFNFLSTFDCCLCETRLTSSVGSFFSIPLAFRLLASKLCTFAIKLSRISVSSRNAYRHNRLEKQFWLTTNFVSFATSPNSQVAASFHNLVTNWSTVLPDCWTAWRNWNT